MDFGRHCARHAGAIGLQPTFNASQTWVIAIKLTEVFGLSPHSPSAPFRECLAYCILCCPML